VEVEQSFKKVEAEYEHKIEQTNLPHLEQLDVALGAAQGHLMKHISSTMEVHHGLKSRSGISSTNNCLKSGRSRI